MDKEDRLRIHKGILRSREKWSNDVICGNADGPRDERAKWIESQRERHVSYDIANMWKLKKNATRLRWWLGCKRSPANAGRHRFDPWPREIPYATEKLSPWASTLDSAQPGPCTLWEKPLQREADPPPLESGPRRQKALGAVKPRDNPHRVF